MDKHSWKDDALCSSYETNLFFDKYEEDRDSRVNVDSLCSSCPVARECFAVGVSQKEWGVWGGIYLERGQISREFSNHRTKSQWAQKWQELTMDE